MKNNFKLLLIMLQLIIIGCNDNQDKSYYIYNSKEYQDKVKEFKINIDQANEIFAKIYFKEFPEKKEHYSTLSIIYGDYYLFPSRPYNLKVGKYFLSGYWVNGNTGEIKKVENNDFINLILEPNKTDKYIKLIKYSDYY